MTDNVLAALGTSYPFARSRLSRERIASLVIPNRGASTHGGSPFRIARMMRWCRAVTPAGRGITASLARD